MNVVLSITKGFLLAGLLGLGYGCAKSDLAESVLQEPAPEFQGSLVSAVTGRPLSEVRVRVLLVQNGRYVAPAGTNKDVVTNDRGEFTVTALQPVTNLIPIEFSKATVIQTDTIVASLNGNPVEGPYRWFPANEGALCISMEPYKSPDFSPEIVSGK